MCHALVLEGLRGRTASGSNEPDVAGAEARDVPRNKDNHEQNNDSTFTKSTTLQCSLLILFIYVHILFTFLFYSQISAVKVQVPAAPSVLCARCEARRFPSPFPEMPRNASGFPELGRCLGRQKWKWLTL